MHTNVKIGLGNASGLLIGGLAGYLVSRKLHKKAVDQVADEVLDEVVPLMFQTMTTMFTAIDDMAKMELSGMEAEEVFNVYQKILSDGFNFFNLTMKDKYGVSVELTFHQESSEG